MNTNYLICPNVTVTYSGTQSVFNHYFLEPGATLVLNSYHYPMLHMKASSQLNAQHSTSAPQSLIMNARAAVGSIFTDTMTQYTQAITWCSSMTFDYALIAGGQTCPIVNATTLPVGDVILTVFPNPASSDGQITVGYAPDLSDQKLMIFNSLGQLVLERQLSELESVISCASIGTAGIYFLTMTDFHGRISGIKRFSLE